MGNPVYSLHEKNYGSLPIYNIYPLSAIKKLCFLIIKMGRNRSKIFLEPSRPSRPNHLNQNNYLLITHLLS